MKEPLALDPADRAALANLLSRPITLGPLTLAPLTVEPCPICGAQGACSYDAEGRPLIHTDTELPEDLQ